MVNNSNMPMPVSQEAPSSPSRKSLDEHYAQSRGKDENVVIEWKNIEFSTLEKDIERSKFLKPAFKEKKILRGLSGKVKSGQLLAILGPTGCGKTSLLNLLAARVPSANAGSFHLTGTVLVNGIARKEENFRRISAYVLQDDHLYAQLTVHETLMLSAHFFLPTETSQAAKDELVEMVIAELSLSKARDTIIGDEKTRGVSGGERKRTTIATQMLTDPAVFFLDEPTSGLDAFQAQSVMECMKNLATSGRIVVTVIHQPRSSIFNMFDKLLVLSEGRTMYYGDAADSVGHFARLGHQCPDVYNPSDFFLDLLSPDSRSDSESADSQNRIKYIGDCFDTHMTSNQGKNASLLDDMASSEIKSIGTEGFDLVKLRRNFMLLCWRTWVMQSRDTVTFFVKHTINIFFALIIGGIYSNIGHHQRGIQNRIGLLFFVVINQCFNGIMGVLNTFPKEKLIVNRERNGRAYATLSYFLAKVVVEIPLNCLPCLVFSCIIYWLVDLNPIPLRFGVFTLVLMLVATCAVSLGLAVSAAMPTIEAANAVGPIAVIIAILFGGFYINISSLPIVANWIPYMSMLRWGFEALCINEFKGLTFDCFGAQNVQACIKTGDQVLNNLAFTHTVRYPVFGLGMVLLGFLVAAYFALDNSKLSFMPLGHVGKKFKTVASQQSKSNSIGMKVSSSCEDLPSKNIELVAVGREDEVKGAYEAVSNSSAVGIPSV